MNFLLAVRHLATAETVQVNIGKERELFDSHDEY